MLRRSFGQFDRPRPIDRRSHPLRPRTAGLDLVPDRRLHEGCERVRIRCGPGSIELDDGNVTGIFGAARSEITTAGNDLAVGQLAKPLFREPQSGGDIPLPIDQPIESQLGLGQHRRAALERRRLGLVDDSPRFLAGLGEDLLGKRAGHRQPEGARPGFGDEFVCTDLGPRQDLLSLLFGPGSRIRFFAERLPHPLPGAHLVTDLAQQLPHLHDVVPTLADPKGMAIETLGAEIHRVGSSGCGLGRLSTKAPGQVCSFPCMFRVHLVDGTYELFRYFFATPSHRNAAGEEVGAVRSVLGSMIGLLEDGATHIGIATDHVIESFRNDLWDGYKDSTGMDPLILGQFQLLEDVLAAAGFTVWPMVEYEADDALGAAAHMAARDERVEQVLICTPDKDLAQCVSDDGRIVQFDRRQAKRYDRAAVIEKFGVPPESIPDYLALVGDSADGFPGLPGWGAKSSSTVLARYGHIEDIPAAAGQWEVTVRGGAKLARTLADNVELALLFRRIATVDLDAPVSASVDEVEWKGPTDRFEEVARTIDATGALRRITKLADRR